jgi:hypothetical protein
MVEDCLMTAPFENFSGRPFTYIVPRFSVALFNARWPGSKLDSSRHYWFEFNAGCELVDTDVPEHSDGPEAAALADDVKQWIFCGVTPEWWPA